LKLIVAVVHDRDKSRLSDALINGGFNFTKVASTGGFLRDGNVTLLIGVDDESVQTVIDTIQENCKTREQYVSVLPPDIAGTSGFVPMPVKVEVGGAVIFTMNVERFDRF
jgi:uncharacterized protein YaaQ